MILNTYKKGLSSVPSENSIIEMKKYSQNLQTSVKAFKKALPEGRMSIKDQLNFKRAFNTFIAIHKFSKYPRDAQWEDILKFFDFNKHTPEMYQNMLISKMMGGGKTAVIGQILGGLIKTDGSVLSVMYFIDELYKINVRQLTSALAQANVMVISIDFLREDYRYSSERLDALRAVLEFARRDGHVICMKITSLQGLINKFNEIINRIINYSQLKKNKMDSKELKRMATSLLNLIAFCKKWASLTIDEAEKALNPNIELNFPLEYTMNLDPVYVQIISFIVHKCHEADFFSGTGDNYEKQRRDGTFFLTLIQNVFEQVIPSKKFSEYLVNSTLKPENYKAIVEFCFLSLDSPNYKDSFKNISNSLKPLFTTKGLELCNFLRREISEWLKDSSKRRIFEHFGPCPAEASGGNENWKNDTFQAIPFEGANKPTIRSRFSSPYWSVNLTFIMYNMIGIPKDRLRDFILDLQDELMLHSRQKYRAKSCRYLLFVELLEKLAASKMLDSKDQTTIEFNYPVTLIAFLAFSILHPNIYPKFRPF